MSINIDASILNHYVQNSEIPLDVLMSKVKNLDLFLSGEKKPTFNQLSNIAKKINIPTGLLLLNHTVDINNLALEFRTLESQSINKMSEALRDTISEMQMKQDFLNQEVESTLSFIGQYSLQDSVDTVVSAIYKTLDIKPFFQSEEKNPLQFMRQKISDIGVFVFFNGKVGNNTHRPLSIKEFRGFVLSDDKAPIIFINQKDTKTGQLFTLVHELVHLFIGVDEIFTLVDTGEYEFDKVEAFVNQITAEILVPKEALLEQDLNNDIAILARKFGVSAFVIARRLLSLGKITRTEYQEHIQKLKEEFENITQYKSSKSGGNFHNNIRFMVDKRFVNYVQNALHYQRISYTDALNIVGVSFKTYKNLLEKHDRG